MDVTNPGVLVVFMGFDQQCYSMRVVMTATAGKQDGMYHATVFTLGMLTPPILLSISWRKQLSVLQQVKDTKGGLAVMWACIAWMSLANLYMVVKVVRSINFTFCC